MVGSLRQGLGHNRKNSANLSIPHLRRPPGATDIRCRALRFTGISAAAAGIARILFFIFIVIFVVLLIGALMVGSALL